MLQYEANVGSIVTLSIGLESKKDGLGKEYTTAAFPPIVGCVFVSRTHLLTCESVHKDVNQRSLGLSHE